MLRGFLMGLILCSRLMVGQSYLPMLDERAEWHLTWCDVSCKTEVYYTDGDTLDSGYRYKVLNGFHYISRSFWLREDIASQKVWLSLPIDAKRQEFLLYDFLLQVGDSITMWNPISPFPQNGGTYVLDSIVSRFLLDGKFHRFFYFSATAGIAFPEQPIWVEGIGSLSLINAPGGTPTWLKHGQLSCYYKVSGAVYENLDTIASCSLRYLGNEGLEPLERIVVLQDPYNANSIRIQGLASGAYELSLYSIEGKLAQKPWRLEQRASSMDLILESGAAGLYVLRVLDLRSQGYYSFRLRLK